MAVAMLILFGIYVFSEILEPGVLAEKHSLLCAGAFVWALITDVTRWLKD